jgi:hypothetical protein
MEGVVQRVMRSIKAMLFYWNYEASVTAWAGLVARMKSQEGNFDENIQ